MSTAAARSALQRAREAVPAQVPARIALPVDAYVAAWNAGDLPALIGLLHNDIVMTMPPWRKTFVGRAAVKAFLSMVWPRHDGFHAVAATANGQPAVAVYTRQGDGPYLAHSLHVLAGEAAVLELILYAPPLGAALFGAFGLEAAVTPPAGRG
jgi:RNA polymerase sigma-70 factor (ECF subfamily)